MYDISSLRVKTNNITNNSF